MLYFTRIPEKNSAFASRVARVKDINDTEGAYGIRSSELSKPSSLLQIQPSVHAVPPCLGVQER